MLWVSRLLSRNGNVLACSRSFATNPVKAIDWLPLPRALPARQGLLLLAVPVPPQAWPAKLELASPLLSATSRALKPHAVAVNAFYDGKGTAQTFREEEAYPARLMFPDGKRFDYPSLTVDGLRSGQIIQDVAHEVDETVSVTPNWGRGASAARQEIMVCTHGARDCRCSDRGGPLVDALRAEIKRRGVEDQVIVREIAHVGGHKFASNAILLPSLDMMSNLLESHAPALLSHVLAGRPMHSEMWAHWRGRYGLTEEQQADIWSQVDPEAKLGDRVAIESGTKETVQLRFQTFQGEIRDVEARMGDDLLRVGKANNLPSIEGVCGGNLECATCHLYLPSKPSIPPVPEPTEEELDMLGYAVGYKDGESRLGCQIKVTPELAKWVEDGGVIGLPRF